MYILIMNKKDISGKRFGKLTAIRLSDSGPRYRTKWICKCDCGNEKTILYGNISRGHTTSCGCIVESSKFRKKHLDSRSKEYSIWAGIKDRCLNTSEKNYHRYGGRGILICDRWKESYENFLSDMGRCPSECSIDRIDNNGNYEPGNCRWATRIQQANNKRTNRLIIKPNGGTCTIADLHRETGIKYTTIKMRLNYGWTYDEIISKK